MRILHIVPDDKFFEAVASLFDKITDIENIYVFYADTVNYSFKYIKSVNKLTVVYDKKEYLLYFSDPLIDVIYFHSFPPSKYKLIKYIDKNKKVIWWSWGYDIYNSYRGLQPLIPLTLCKPLTQQYISSKNKTILDVVKRIIFLITKRNDNRIREHAIKRIDFCKTVLPVEYEMLKKHPFFNAKYFNQQVYVHDTLVFHDKSQNLLIGNSANYTNNHLDIFSCLDRTNCECISKIIVPINYGDKSYGRFLKEKIKNDKVIFLENFLPYTEYSEMIGSCTHAIFGHIREQAIGNIYLCFRKGIKVFLYKDSIAYKQFKEKDGYIIYSIDDELGEKELGRPLTKEEALYNYNLFYKTVQSESDAVELLHNSLSSLQLQ